jgi:hypothetical protein
MLLVDDDAPFTIFPVMTREERKKMDEKYLIPKINFCCVDDEKEREIEGEKEFCLTTSSLYC